MAAAWVQDGGRAVRVASSHDGGVTWNTPTVVPAGGTGHRNVAGAFQRDNCLPADPQGAGVDVVWFTSVKRLDGACEITILPGHIDGYPLPFLTQGILGSGTLLNKDGTGTMAISSNRGQFWVFVTSSHVAP